MAFSQEQYQVIANALQKKANRFCPACGVRAWVIQTEGLVSLQIQNYQVLPPSSPLPWMRATSSIPGAVAPVTPIIGPGGPVLPCIVTVCKNCGLTQLHNVFMLGVAELLGISGGK